MDTGTLGCLFYRLESPGISTDDFHKIDAKYRKCYPVSLGEALRTATSLRMPLRVERIEGNYALMWLDKDKDGREVSAIQVLLYQGSDGAKQMYVLKNLDWPNKPSWLTLTEEQRTCILAFEARVNGLLGTLPYSKVSESAISYAMEHCGATRIRSDGGTYFIPHTREHLWKAYCDAWKDNAEFFLVDAAVTGRTINSVAAGVREDLQSRVKDILEKLDSLKRPETLETRVGDLSEILQLAEMYEAVLGTKLDDIRVSVAAVKQVAAIHMGLLRATK
jgi:hypothetical protein